MKGPRRSRGRSGRSRAARSRSAGRGPTTPRGTAARPDGIRAPTTKRRSGVAAGATRAGRREPASITKGCFIIDLVASGFGRKLQLQQHVMKHPLQTTPIVEWNAGAPVRRLDEVVAEEPLEVRVNGAPVTVTMRTPGDDFDLAIGLLFTEGIIDARDDVDDVKYAREARGQRQCNVVEVTLRAGKSLDEDHLRRHFVASSSCGICGKASIDAVRARNLRPLDSGWRFDAALLPRLPDALRHAQTLFGRTGG